MELAGPPAGRYDAFEGDVVRVYQAMALALGKHPDQIPWDRFTEADWELLLRMAGHSQEGVGPALYSRFKGGSWPRSCPEQVRQMLERQYYETLGHNSLLFSELAKFAALLDAAAIRYIVLKGAALAATVYEEPGLRSMGDLDVMVPVDDFAEAQSLAESLGYRLAAPPLFSRSHELQGRHLEMRRMVGSNPVALELHDEPIGGRGYRTQLPASWFWEHSQKINIKNGDRVLPATAEVLSSEAHALFLSGHLVLQHGGSLARMIWFLDIHKLVRSDRVSFDLSEFSQLAQTRGWSAVAQAALSSCIARFETPIPSETMARLHRDSKPWLKRLVAQQQQEPRSPLGREVQRMRAFRWTARLRIWMALIVPNAAYMRWRYPTRSAKSLVGAYLYRWTEALRKGN